MPNLGRVIPLLVGLLLLLLYASRRQYGLLVAGCIVTGVGSGIALQGATSGEQAGGIVVLCLGLGFLSIYVISLALRLPERHWWPLVPGGVLSLIGGVLVSGRFLDDALRWWPIVLVVIGLLVLGQALLRPRN